ncbi:hypothetical protein WJX84_006983 [Apatococcus fuscideae]|uniref:Uncharacterized protein n=1 Tax=Apatococcus fuscideae TaxID=2026836 RepID=A0AAW1SCN2_9CHLO
MPRGKGKQRPSLKPVKPKPSPAAPPVDVCLEVLRRLEDVKDKLAFSAAFHNALEASRDKRAWTVCKTADVSTLYGMNKVTDLLKTRPESIQELHGHSLSSMASTFWIAAWHFLPNLQCIRWIARSRAFEHEAASEEPEQFSLPKGLQIVELHVELDGSYEEDYCQPFALSRLQSQGFAPAVTGLAISMCVDELEVYDPDAWQKVELSDVSLPRLQSLDLRVTGITGQLLASNLKDLTLNLTESLHWSSLELCQRLERVDITIGDPDLDLELCEITLMGCKHSCFQNLTELSLAADVLREDGQLGRLTRHKLKNVSLAIRQPHMSIFDISELCRFKWASTKLRFEDGFSCKLSR